MAEKLKTPSVLAFDRKLDVSDAAMLSGIWNGDDWQPLEVQEKTVRGTIAPRPGKKEKSDEDLSVPNIQTIDFCNLPPHADTLLVQFSLRVLPGIGEPAACNDAGYSARLQELVADYAREHGFSELGQRYATNIANGRFLWRNRLGADQIEIRVERLENGQPAATWTFDALSISLRDFSTPPEVQELGAVIASGLAGKAVVNLRVSAFVRMGFGLDVYPSQELIISTGRAAKSKTLYAPGGKAAMHSQKIGNALRAIDNWHPEAAETGPIAVEPYGAVTNHGRVYRSRREKADFYTLLDNWTLHGQSMSADEQHFIMAVLVRGGVFGEG